MTTITWTTSRGSNIAVTVGADFGLDLSGNRKTSGRRDAVITVTVDGALHAVADRHDIKAVTHPTCVAAIRKVGLSAANLAAINAAIAVVDAESTSHNAACAAHEAALADAANKTAAITRRMAYGE